MKLTQQSPTQLSLTNEFDLLPALISGIVGSVGALAGIVAVIYGFLQLSTPKLNVNFAVLWIILMLLGSVFCILMGRIAAPSLWEIFTLQQITAQFDTTAQQLTITQRQLFGSKTHHYPLPDIRNFYIKLGGDWRLLAYKLFLVMADSDEIALGEDYSQPDLQTILSQLQHFLQLKAADPALPPGTADRSETSHS